MTSRFVLTLTEENINAFKEKVSLSAVPLYTAATCFYSATINKPVAAVTLSGSTERVVTSLGQLSLKAWMEMIARRPNTERTQYKRIKGNRRTTPLQSTNKHVELEFHRRNENTHFVRRSIIMRLLYTTLYFSPAIPAH